MTDREIMEQALEALEYWVTMPDHSVITALRERLAQPEQEPVANGWSVFNTAVEVWSGLSFADAVAELSPERMERGWSAVCVINKDNPPIYTAPPRREWVGLTEEERDAIWDDYNLDGADVTRAIEAALKAKNYD